jgi:hypothetical protein
MLKFSLVLSLLLLNGCNTTVPEYEESSIVRQMTPPPAPPSGEVIAQKIVKNASLTFETQDIDAEHKIILQLTQQYKGIVQTDNSGINHSRLFRNLTIKVPSENFQSVIDKIGDGVAYFDRREITRRDVTEEFVDIEARLKAKKELEKRYLELLKKAQNVKDMLEIERGLSSIREEIEARQGRLQYLESQVSMSTISLSFYKVTAETGVRVSYGHKIINAFQGGWNGVSVFFLGILYVWPLLVLAILFILIIRGFIKRSKRK